MENNLRIREEGESPLEGAMKEAGFTDNELLIARTILLNKALYRMSTELMGPRRTLLFEDKPEAKHVEKVMTSIDYLTTQNRDLAQIYASKLGINEKRFLEIQDYVYEHERKI